MLRNGTQSRKSKLVEQPRLRLPLMPGQPNPISKLTDALQAKICGLIANGARYEQACLQCNITRATFWNWRVRGTVDPKGRYGRFLAAVNTALSECAVDAAEAERRVNEINAARRARRAARHVKKKGTKESLLEPLGEPLERLS
jgi:hypothetical protein